MDLRSYRLSRGLSQAACAKQLELKSKSSICEIESGAQPPSMTLALRIEKWSGGEVPARQLLPAKKAALLPDTSISTRG